VILVIANGRLVS